ncbi:hypothetical protein K2173_019896 [Erythroxylum novogranatense]|uniref:Uncharacterized protein n=1 Tax=Erythroxylum novogranatense TaxID=1862640 RepID=A0AAV8U6E1_9ROSI|nr:hypothetical protein K2173_019896 [Erythroxylum novogranatense]
MSTATKIEGSDVSGFDSSFLYFLLPEEKHSLTEEEDSEGTLVQPFPIPHKSLSVEIKGNKTDIVICSYDDHHFVSKRLPSA